jgi:hypothetical protein
MATRGLEIDDAARYRLQDNDEEKYLETVDQTKPSLPHTKQLAQ